MNQLPILPILLPLLGGALCLFAEHRRFGEANAQFHRSIVQAARIAPPNKERWLASSTKKEEVLRELVDTVGKPGQLGQDLQNVVSVAMLSEGWDAKTVTHIMGLRAFTSQLLCEQVIGRGLRRVAYDIDPETGLYAPEFVNVFGVPLSVAMPPGGDGPPPPPPKPSVQIKALPERQVHEIKWPNILRVDQVVRPQLVVEWSKVPLLTIDPAKVALHADIAPALGGAADWSQITTIDLEKLPEEFRLQRLVFKAAQKAFEQLQDQFKGQREYLLFQLVRLVETLLASDKIDIPSLFHQDSLRKRILFSMHMDAIVQHLMAYVIEQNTLRLEAVFDGERPVGSTRDMRTWYTTRIAEPTQRCQSGARAGAAFQRPHRALWPRTGETAGRRPPGGSAAGGQLGGSARGRARPALPADLGQPARHPVFVQRRQRAQHLVDPQRAGTPAGTGAVAGGGRPRTGR